MSAVDGAVLTQPCRNPVLTTINRRFFTMLNYKISEDAAAVAASRKMTRKDWIEIALFALTVMSVPTLVTGFSLLSTLA